MPELDEIIKEWEAVLSRDPLDAPWDLIDDTLTLLKNQQEAIQTAKNVAKRYAQLLGEKGMDDIRTWFSVAKAGKLLYRYQNKRAEWTYSSDQAWLTFDKEMAEGFAKLTKGKVVEVTIAVRQSLDG